MNSYVLWSNDDIKQGIAHFASKYFVQIKILDTSITRWKNYFSWEWKYEKNFLRLGQHAFLDESVLYPDDDS